LYILKWRYGMREKGGRIVREEEEKEKERE
jgi:hypothetical protein